MHVTVSGYMEPITVKKFVIVGSWWRVEAVTYLAFNKIS